MLFGPTILLDYYCYFLFCLCKFHRVKDALTGIWGDLFSGSSGSSASTGKDKGAQDKGKGNDESSSVNTSATQSAKRPRKSIKDGSTASDGATSQLARQTQIDKAEGVVLLVNQARNGLVTEEGLRATKTTKLTDLHDKVKKCLHIDVLSHYSHDWEPDQPATQGVTLMRELQAAEKILPQATWVARANSSDDLVDPSMLLASLKALGSSGWAVHAKAFEAVVRSAVTKAAKDYNWKELCDLLTCGSTDLGINITCYSDILLQRIPTAVDEKELVVQREIDNLRGQLICNAAEGLISRTPDVSDEQIKTWTRCLDLCTMVLGSSFREALDEKVKDKLDHLKLLCSIATGKVTARHVGTTSIDTSVNALQASKCSWWKLFNTNRGGLTLMQCISDKSAQLVADATCQGEYDQACKTLQVLRDESLQVNLFWQGGDLNLHAQSTVTALQTKITSIKDKASADLLSSLDFKPLEEYLETYMAKLKEAMGAKFAEDVAGLVSASLDIICTDDTALNKMDALKKVSSCLSSFMNDKMPHPFIQSSVSLARIFGKGKVDELTTTMTNTRSIMAILGNLKLNGIIQHVIEHRSTTLEVSDTIIETVKSLSTADCCNIDKSFVQGTKLRQSLVGFLAWLRLLLARHVVGALESAGCAKALRAFLTAASIPELAKHLNALDVKAGAFASLKMSKLLPLFVTGDAEHTATLGLQVAIPHGLKDTPADALDVMTFCCMLPAMVPLAQLVSVVGTCEKAMKMQTAIKKMFDAKSKKKPAEGKKDETKPEKITYKQSYIGLITAALAAATSGFADSYVPLQMYFTPSSKARCTAVYGTLAASLKSVHKHIVQDFEACVTEYTTMASQFSDLHAKMADRGAAQEAADSKESGELWVAYHICKAFCCVLCDTSNQAIELLSHVDKEGNSTLIESYEAAAQMASKVVEGSHVEGHPFFTISQVVANLSIAKALTKAETEQCTRQMLRDQASTLISNDPVLKPSDEFVKLINK